MAFNIIVLMVGLCDEFLNHVKWVVAQLPADQRTWEHIKETAAVQQDHESNRRTRANSFGKGGSVNYTDQRGKSSSPSNKSGDKSNGAGGGGKKKQHWREKPMMRASWVGPRHMSRDACMVCNYTGQKATQCKMQKNKQNWSGWPSWEPAEWPPRTNSVQGGPQPQNAQAPPQQQQQQTGGVAAVSSNFPGYQPSSWTNFV